jgi:hypothetical protein
VPVIFVPLIDGRVLRFVELWLWRFDSLRWRIAPRLKGQIGEKEVSSRRDDLLVN